MTRLEGMVRRSPALMRALDALATLGLPSGAVAAGAIVGTVWNVLTGREPTQGIADLDVVFHDAGAEHDALETHAKARLEALLGPRFPWPIEVVNQARVHEWYEGSFGRAARPFTSLDDAMRHWPTTATAVALEPRDHAVHVHAPFGLEDLLAMRVRPNRVLAPEATYRRKTERWKALWPEIEVEPW
ncbi:MAG: nucleotidyltransferase family protein [Myxococcota bacterium]